METQAISEYKRLIDGVNITFTAFLLYKNSDTDFYKGSVRRWKASDLEPLKTALLSFDVEDLRHELYSLDTEPLKRFCRDLEQRYTPLYNEEIFSNESNKELFSLLQSTHGGTATIMMMKLKEIANIANLMIGDVCSIIDELQRHREQPQEPSTERAKKAFKKAVEAGYMEETATGYKWLYNGGSKASLGYFIVQVYNPDGSKVTPFKALDNLFNVTRLDSASNRALLEAKTPQKWRGKIDELLKGL